MSVPLKAETLTMKLQEGGPDPLASAFLRRGLLLEFVVMHLPLRWLRKTDKGRFALTPLYCVAISNQIDTPCFENYGDPSWIRGIAAKIRCSFFGQAEDPQCVAPAS